jgi:hypothetical protein
VTVAVAVWLGSATLAAVIVAVVLELISGALKSPVLEMDPCEAVQVTAVFATLPA